MPPIPFSRRAFLRTLAMVGGAAAIGLPEWVGARPGSPATVSGTADHKRDWAWLVGNWDVFHRRLEERLVGDTHWQTFMGRSALWLTMGGLGTIDDNMIELPGDPYRGLTLRTFDPGTGKWSIWWLDGRNPSHIDPPVLGGFHGDAGLFFGHDTFKGRPITMRFRWSDIHTSRPWWEQAFSADDGASWEVNWRNYFTRTSATPTPLPKLADAPRDFDFLVGSWSVRHRRLRHRLVGNHDWDSFGGTLVNWPVLGGQGNVGDNLMALPSGMVRGIGLRAFDRASGQWLSWWIDGRTPSVIQPPVRGSRMGDVGTFIGDDDLDGRPIKTRVVWSRITASSARWEQSCSVDGGRTWELNWVSDFTRMA